jgi:hypothetical protein
MMPPEVHNGYWYVIEIATSPDGGKFPKIYGGGDWFAIYATVDGVEVAVIRSQTPLSSADTLDIPVGVALEAAGYTTKPGG